MCVHLCASGINCISLAGWEAVSHTQGPNCSQGGGLGSKPQGGQVTPEEQSGKEGCAFFDEPMLAYSCWHPFAPGGQILTEMEVWKESWGHCLFEPLDSVSLGLFQLQKLIIYIPPTVHVYKLKLSFCCLQPRFWLRLREAVAEASTLWNELGRHYSREEVWHELSTEHWIERGKKDGQLQGVETESIWQIGSFIHSFVNTLIHFISTILYARYYVCPMGYSDGKSHSMCPQGV